MEIPDASLHKSAATELLVQGRSSCDATRALLILSLASVMIWNARFLFFFSLPLLSLLGNNLPRLFKAFPHLMKLPNKGFILTGTKYLLKRNLWGLLFASLGLLPTLDNGPEIICYCVPDQNFKNRNPAPDKKQKICPPGLCHAFDYSLTTSST